MFNYLCMFYPQLDTLRATPSQGKVEFIELEIRISYEERFFSPSFLVTVM